MSRKRSQSCTIPTHAAFRTYRSFLRSAETIFEEVRDLAGSISDPEVREETIQRVCEKVVKHWRLVPADPERRHAFLATILRREFINHLKYQQRRMIQPRSGVTGADDVLTRLSGGQHE